MRNPRLRVALAQPQAPSINFIFGDAKRLMIETLLSVELSSTTMISVRRHVCASAERSVVSIQRSALWQGIMIDTRGVTDVYKVSELMGGIYVHLMRNTFIECPVISICPLILLILAYRN